jgi:lysine/ornithine N-monooxygenase
MVKLLHLLYAKQQQQLQATQERQQKEEEESHRLLNLFSQQDAKARTEEEDTLAIILALGYLGTPGYHSVQT